MRGDVETYFDGAQWHSRICGEDEPFYTAATRGRAVNVGRFGAQSRRVDHVVTEKDGTIGERQTFGRGPSHAATTPGA